MLIELDLSMNDAQALFRHFSEHQDRACGLSLNVPRAGYCVSSDPQLDTSGL